MVPELSLLLTLVLFAAGTAAGIVGALLGLGGGVFLVPFLGLVILMATPVARVVVSVVEYALGRDWLFVTLTSGVLVILIGSLMVATLRI